MEDTVTAATALFREFTTSKKSRIVLAWHGAWASILVFVASPSVRTSRISGVPDLRRGAAGLVDPNIDVDIEHCLL